MIKPRPIDVPFAEALETHEVSEGIYITPFPLPKASQQKLLMLLEQETITNDELFDAIFPKGRYLNATL